MIKLRQEVNKSELLRELRKEAEEMYRPCWQPKLQVSAFMSGVESLFKLLRLPKGSCESERFICPDCKGTGKIQIFEWRTKKCQKCNGTGQTVL